MNTRLTFRQGLTDALPIFFGYFSVSIAFGILASSGGIPVWLAATVSMTSFTGTGQFVWLDLTAASAALAQTALALAVINARYFLMSLSLSQKLPSEITLWQRLVIAFGNTDEIFAVAMTRAEPLNFKYMLGLIICSYSGWVGGTAVGGLASGAIPAPVLSALGIALYAMFIALIVPPAKKSRPILAVVLAAASLNLLLSRIHALGFLTSGWQVIISGVAASALGAAFFPAHEETADAPGLTGQAKEEGVAGVK